MDGRGGGRAARADGRKVLGIQRREQQNGAGSDDSVCARARAVAGADRLQDVFSCRGGGLAGALSRTGQSHRDLNSNRAPMIMRSFNYRIQGLLRSIWICASEAENRSQTAMNSAANTGPITEPLSPKIAMPPKGAISTT